MRTIVRFLMLTTVLTISASVFGQDIRFRKLDVPGALSTVPKGINAVGDVVGLTVDSDGNGHGFVFHQGGFTTIDVPGATFTNAVGINARGDIVGRWSDRSGHNHGYLLSEGKFKKFDVEGCDRGDVPHGINNVGNIVGTCVDADGNVHAFLLTGGSVTIFDFPGAALTDAYKLTDEGEIVGYYNDSNDPGGGYVRTPKGKIRRVTVPHGTYVGCRGINELGDIVGEFDGVKDGQTHGYLLKDHQYITLDVPAATFTVASDINNQGVIVGDYIDADGNDRGFIAHVHK